MSQPLLEALLKEGACCTRVAASFFNRRGALKGALLGRLRLKFETKKRGRARAA
jgi:hypothetical protein